jgi:ribosomal-protein-alanine N-acetyltransferase
VKFTIREYRVADFDAIYAIDQLCYAPGIAYSRGELRWYLRLPGADCLIAKCRNAGKERVVVTPSKLIATNRVSDGKTSGAKGRGKQIAGFIITARQELHGHIVTIDVLETHRRAGLGASLLHRAEVRLRKRGAREVWLETATDNEAAIAFWQKHGYRTRGRIRNYYPGGLDAFSMSKPLAGAAAQEN